MVLVILKLGVHSVLRRIRLARIDFTEYLKIIITRSDGGSNVSSFEENLAIGP